MKATILLNKDADTRQIEDEEKSKFIRNILEQIGLPVDEFWVNPEKTLSVEEKIKLRQILNAYNIIIIDDLSGHMQMYVENDLVAEWKKCTYKLKTDLRYINPSKRFYLEMNIDAWSIFEKDE
jgi:ABC-type antimicrobial peptide transport system ATPase subunit